MTLKGSVAGNLGFPQVCFKLVVLYSIFFNQASSQEEPYFASFERCIDSTLGDEVEFPRTLFSSQDLGNNTLETLPVRLTSGEDRFSCEKEKGRVAILQVALNSLDDVTQVLSLYKDGYLIHDKMYYSRENYCVLSSKTENNDFSLSIKICEPRCTSENTICVQKCCQPGNVWDLKHYSRGNGALTCESPGEIAWKPDLYLDQYNRMDKLESESVNVRYVDAHPKNFCDGGFFLMTLKDYDGLEASPFRILKTGKAVMKIGRNSWEEVPSNMYCVDGAMNFIQNGTELDESINGHYSGNPEDTVMLVCTGFLEEADEEFNGPNLLYVVAMLVSSVFLLITAIVHGVLWKRQKSVHGMTFLGYILSLLMSFLFLSFAHLVNNEEWNCAIIGIACHFFFLSTFTWLSTLNFDIYYTFRSLNPNPRQMKDVIRFACYAVFAIGLPSVIVTVGLILDAIYGDDPVSEIIVPAYGKTRCTMDRSADFPYLFGPISFLLGCNLLLFPITLYYIYKNQKSTKLTGVKSSMLKHKIQFFTKLIILAGFSWVSEVVSWASTDPGKPIHWVWKLLDLVNIFQSLAILVIVVCNRKTLEEFSCLKRLNTIIEKASGVAAANSGRKQSNTHISSVFDVPGLEAVELGGK